MERIAKLDEHLQFLGSSHAHWLLYEQTFLRISRAMKVQEEEFDLAAGSRSHRLGISITGPQFKLTGS